ncbi:MAG: hypothetical protein FVQ77_08680, partial [Cytophagales bacterium]|nr:hypothetical protein [Cytophagales bacterium]
MKTPVFKKSVAPVLFCSLVLFAQHVKGQWSQLTSGSNCNLESVHFPHPDTGYVACQNDTVLKTDDQGGSWVPKAPLPAFSSPSSLYFTDASIGYVTSAFGFSIYKTIDGGNSWSAQSTTLWAIYSIYFPATDTGFAVGGEDTDFDFFLEHTVAKTTDGGATWSSTSLGGFDDVLTGVYFTDVNTGYAVGTLGVIFKTTNGGVSWTAQTSGTFDYLEGVHFPSVDTGYVVGWTGTILKTTDGGTNWNAQISGTTENLYSVYFVNANTGYAVGDNGTILKTINGGTTWIPESSGTTENLKSVYFTYPDTGYAVGFNGTILKTPPFPDDVGVIAIDAPPSGYQCGLNATENVTIRVKNFGINTQDTIRVGYTFNGGPIIFDTILGLLNPGDTVTFTFDTLADLSIPGSYIFDAWTALSGDANNANDSLKNYQVIANLQQVDTICIYDVNGGSGDTTCSNFTFNICGDGSVTGDTTLKTSDQFILNTVKIDSIIFNLYSINDVPTPADLTFYLNSDSIGAFTDNNDFNLCIPPTYPFIVSVTDTVALNNAFICDTNTLGVQHNGLGMRVAGYTAVIYSSCTSCGGCTNPDLPTLTVASSTICDGASTTLSVSAGLLNDAASWQWYSGSCGGTPEGTGTSILISPTVTTTYYARGEGGCVTPGSCSSIAITVNPTYDIVDAPVSICDGSSIMIYGIFRSVAGTYFDSLTTINGCDSVHSTVLTLDPTYNIVDAPVSVCDGSSIMIYGISRSAAGTYYDSLLTGAG